MSSSNSLHQRRSSRSSSDSSRRGELGSIFGNRKRPARDRSTGSGSDVDARAALVGSSQRERGDDRSEPDEPSRDGVDSGRLRVGGVVPGGAGDVLFRLSFFFEEVFSFFFRVRVSKKRKDKERERECSNKEKLFFTSTAKMLDCPAESSSV